MKVSKKKFLMVTDCWDDLSVISLDRDKLIIRGDREILIPKDGRQQLVVQLHATNLSYQGMHYLARNKIFWPVLQDQLNFEPRQASSGGFRGAEPLGPWGEYLSGLLLIPKAGYPNDKG